MLTIEQMHQIHEDFMEQYHAYYAEPENRYYDSFYKFAEGRMTPTECDNIGQSYYSDLSGECDREGFYE